MGQLLGWAISLFFYQFIALSQLDSWTPKNTNFSIVTLPSCYKTIKVPSKIDLDDHPINAAWRNFKTKYFKKLPREIQREIILLAVTTPDTKDVINLGNDALILEKSSESNYQTQVAIHSQDWLAWQRNYTKPETALFQKYTNDPEVSLSHEDREYLSARFKRQYKGAPPEDFCKILYYDPTKSRYRVKDARVPFPIYTENIREWPICKQGGGDGEAIEATPYPNKYGDLLVENRIINVNIQKTKKNLRELDYSALPIEKWCYPFCVLNPKYPALAKVCSQTHYPMNYSTYDEFMKKDFASTELAIITWDWKKHSKTTKTFILDQLLSSKYFKQAHVFNQLSKAFQEFNDHGERRKEGVTYLFDNPLYTCQVESIEWVKGQSNLLAITFTIAQWLKHIFQNSGPILIDNIKPHIQSDRFLLLLNIQFKKIDTEIKEIKQDDIDITIWDIKPLKKIPPYTATTFEYLRLPI